jgi:hypothetical protein
MCGHPWSKIHWVYKHGMIFAVWCPICGTIFPLKRVVRYLPDFEGRTDLSPTKNDVRWDAGHFWDPSPNAMPHRRPSITPSETDYNAP